MRLPQGILLHKPSAGSLRHWFAPPSKHN